MHAAHAHAPPAAVLAAAGNLFSLVPSCLMTLEPASASTHVELTQREVGEILSQCGSKIALVPAEESARQLPPAGSDPRGHIEFEYAGLIENHAPFAITGDSFAFVSVIGFSDAAMAVKVGERMAKHDRATTSCRGFVCSNVIVQRLAPDGANPDKLDLFLLERFAAAAAK